MLQKKEEAKQTKIVKVQGRDRKNQDDFRIRQENKMKNQIRIQSRKLA